MLIATIAFLTLMFGGGDIFFLDRLDKGVKTYVVDDDRRDDARAIIKTYKGDAKAFNKLRKANLKELKALLRSSETSTGDFDALFVEMATLREQHESRSVDQRVAATALITDEEWVGIIAQAEEKAIERLAKQEKKAGKAKEKGKLPYPKTRKAIDKAIADEPRRAQITARLEAFIATEKQLESDLDAINASQNAVIATRKASRADLLAMTDEINSVRQESIAALLAFHDTMRSTASAEEMDRIMKAFNKDMKLLAR